MRIRERLKELMGADRWVNGVYPAVAPDNASEISRLVKGYPNDIIVCGSGSNFPDDYQPGLDSLVLLTNRLNKLELYRQDQCLEVEAGCLVNSVTKILTEESLIVPSLIRFSCGTVGGRLAAVSSRLQADSSDDWVSSLMGLQVVIPSGEILDLGGRCIKDVAGYDLKHLFIGSRGAFGVITKAIFRIFPFYSYKAKPYRYNHASRRYDAKWRRIFDPVGRMRPGP